MSGIRLLDLIKPFASIVPEIELPYEKSIFDEKVVYTIAIAVVYLLLGLPINGVNDEKIADPFSWLRGTFASQPGTLLEFGVLPAVLSAFLWQILAGLKFIRIDFHSSNDRQLFQTLQKITSIVFGLTFAALLAFADYFEPIDYFTRTPEGSESLLSPSFMSKVLIVAELTVSNTIVTLLAELLDKGYGFGPGILAFITVSSATTLSTSLLGLTTVWTPRGSESTGALVQFIRNLFSADSYSYAIYEAFTRQNLANLTQVYVAIAAFIVVVYLSNCRSEISIKSSKVRSMVSVYPVKLVYCGAIPLIFTYAVLYAFNIVGFSASRIFAGNKFVELLGSWELEPEFKRTSNLNSGLLFLISAAPSSSNTILNLIRPFTYISFVVIVSTLFSEAWPGMSGSAPKDTAKQFKDQDLALVGRRDISVSKELAKVIIPSARIGAIITSFAAAFCECSGRSKGLTYGTIAGILSGLSILEELVQEWQQTGAAANSQLSQFLPTQ
ncbi:DEKNAAC104742 [Brettanomyces naardenensis]|uniref:DEKNAAC104743 n=1 Tax=Brettanomyces naardenensis TaxID=13370 RepID=A0A448YRN8_BRENA|nr:DEKNAAC104742 [Brettanomyces naardenensis]